MPIVNGVNNYKALNPSPANIISPGLQGGRVRVSTDVYEAAALAVDSQILMNAPLPEGAVIIGMELSYDALGAGVTLQVGDTADNDRYMVAASAATAGQRATILVDGMGYTVTGATNNQIMVVTGGAAATGTVKLTVLWSME